MAANLNGYGDKGNFYIRKLTPLILCKSYATLNKRCF